jgi:hypothetical protein
LFAENLVYALIQVAHNFGAVALVALPAVGLWLRTGPAGAQRISLILIAVAVAQASTGVSFGAAGLYFHGALPDIHGVAVVALWVKVTALGFALAAGAAILAYGSGWSEARRAGTWKLALFAAAAALTAAAFLRWYS